MPAPRCPIPGGQRFRRWGPPARCGHKQLAHRPGDVQRIGEQPGGVLALFAAVPVRWPPGSRTRLRRHPAMHHVGGHVGRRVWSTVRARPQWDQPPRSLTSISERGETVRLPVWLLFPPPQSHAIPERSPRRPRIATLHGYPATMRASSMR